MSRLIRISRTFKCEELPYQSVVRGSEKEKPTQPWRIGLVVSMVILFWPGRYVHFDKDLSYFDPWIHTAVHMRQARTSSLHRVFISGGAEKFIFDVSSLRPYSSSEFSVL